MAEEKKPEIVQEEPKPVNPSSNNNKKEEKKKNKELNKYKNKNDTFQMIKVIMKMENIFTKANFICIIPKLAKRLMEHMH